MPQISFLILTYNSSSDIARLLDSIFLHVGAQIKKGEIEMVIVDNASTDETRSVIREYFSSKKELFETITTSATLSKSVRFFQSEINNGYARGINLAAKFARGDVLVVINPDAQLQSGGFDKVIDEFDRNKKLAIAGLKITNFDKVSEKTAGSFYNPFTFLLFALGLERLVGLRTSPVKKTRVDYVSGGFVAFKKDLFESLDGYDEDYFMYVEDMDICYRAWKNGLQTYFLPYVTLSHKGQGSSNREFAIVNIYKGLRLFYEKHGNNFEQIYTNNLLSIKAAIIIFLGTISNKKDIVATYQKALKSLS